VIGHREDLWLYVISQPETHVGVFLVAFVAGLAVVALIGMLTR
jgi:hypothetical protein